MQKRSANNIPKKFLILFILSAFVGSVALFILSHQNQGNLSNKSHKKRLLSSSSGIDACKYIDYEINDGSVMTKGTSNALNYFSKMRPTNKMITPLQTGSEDDWDSYFVSLVPIILPFFLVSLLCLFTYIGCLSQIIFKSFCRCCKRDLYRNPYTKNSIFWFMLLTIVCLVLCMMAATVSIIQLEYTYKGYQQLHCQSYLLFDHFLNGNTQAQNWIGLKDVTSNLQTVQNQISSQINGFKLLFDTPPSSESTEIQKQKLQNSINTMFDTFKTVNIPDPTKSGNKLSLDSYITLEVKGFTNIQSKVQNDFQSTIDKISNNLSSLQSNAQSLDDNSVQNTSFIQQKKTQIEEFTVLFKQAQTHVNNQFELGNDFFFWYRVSMYTILGMLLFCCLFTFVSFILVYTYKIKRLELFNNIVWSLTSLLSVLGFFGAGIIYTMSFIFYEGSLSFHSFITDQTVFNSMKYVLDPKAASYLQDCVFGTNASLVDIFGLRNYLMQVNNISLYISLLDQSFGGLQIPNLSITNQIQDCSNYIDNIGSLAPNQSSSTLQLLNTCINQNKCVCDSSQPTVSVSCSKVLLTDTFVFTSSACSADGIKRFILSKGQEIQNLDTNNCIFVAINTLNSDLSTNTNNNLNYQTRLQQVQTVDTSSNCQTLKTCTLNYVNQLINYASESGYQIQLVKQKLKSVQSDFISLYQQYYNLFEKSIQVYYLSNLQKQILLVSDSQTGIYSNLQCQVFGEDLRQLNKYLTNNYLFDLYTLDWWAISTFVGMIVGLSLMYFSISRLQFWAYLDGQVHETIQNSKVKAQEIQTKKVPITKSNNATPLKQVQEVQNTSIMNSSMLKSLLINQSAYNKKYLPKNSSFTNFQYQESLPDIQDNNMKQNITMTQQNEVTKDIELENYKN